MILQEDKQKNMSNGVNNKHQKILIIDDDQEIVRQAKDTLTINLDCTVDAAYNGKEGLDKMKEDGPYDLIILAVLIPKLNGIEVCEYIMKNDGLRKIPVLLTSVLPLTSETFQRALHKFEELSIVKDILEKPFGDKDLIEKVEAIISENQNINHKT